MVLGKLDSHVQKNETGPSSYTTHKDKLKMDERSFFFFYLLMIVTEREREAETQAEGEAGSMHREPDVGFDPESPGAQRGIRSWVSRIAPWAKGRC